MSSDLSDGAAPQYPMPDLYARAWLVRRGFTLCYLEIIFVLLFIAMMSNDQTAEVVRIGVSFPENNFLESFANWAGAFGVATYSGLLGFCVGAHATYVLEREMGAGFVVPRRDRIVRIVRVLLIPKCLERRLVSLVRRLDWPVLDGEMVLFRAPRDVAWIPFVLAASMPVVGGYGILRAMNLTDFFGADLIIDLRLALGCLWCAFMVAFLWAFWFGMPALLRDDTILRVYLCFILFMFCGLYSLNFFRAENFAGANVIVAAWIGALLAALTVLDLMSRRWRLPLVGAVILAFFVFEMTGLSDNHTLRSQTLQPNSGPVEEVFKSWGQARKAEIEAAVKAKKSFPIFLIAAEGGGIRAAYTTNAVLSKLEAENSGFLHHVFAMVGVSGGSVGAAMFSASHIASTARRACGTTESSVAIEDHLPAPAAARAALGADLLSPTLASLFGYDFIARFLPGSWLGLEIWDRGAALEDAIDGAWRSHGQASLRGMCFGDAWTGPGGDLPALILLGTDVSTGQRVAASHLQFLKGHSTGGSCPADPPATEAGLRTLAAEIPDKDVPLLTAAVMSARFPVVSPSARLPCRGIARHVVDGGYFENSGVTTLLEMLDRIAPELSSVEGARVIVLRIANGGASAGTAWTRRGGGFSTILPEPVTALLNTQDSRAAVAVSNLERRLDESQRITFTLTSSAVAIPLGWQLGKAAQDEIDRQVGGATNASQFRQVAGALK